MRKASAAMPLVLLVWATLFSLQLDLASAGGIRSLLPFLSRLQGKKISAAASTSASKGQFDYDSALSKSFLFLEAQRSGKLPASQRVKWRGDSALGDGSDKNVDLTGGYYDAGDNVKYTFPMAFTVTTLSWGTLQWGKELKAANELGRAREAIKWATDFLLKAVSTPDTIYYQVGDADRDHQCWERPEDMDTPRTTYVINRNSPGSDVAGEVAAAFAAASLVFRNVNPSYASTLLSAAESAFRIASTWRGNNPSPNIYKTYSGYEDELVWASLWLFKATNESSHLQYAVDNFQRYHISEFNWDQKWPGAQVLATQLYYEGHQELEKYIEGSTYFICSVHPDSPQKQAQFTPGGMLYVRDGANSQYVTSSSLLFLIFSEILSAKNAPQLTCGSKTFNPTDLLQYSQNQIDYLLGNNPRKYSYMVGFGSRYPQQVHHRAASIPSKKEMETPVQCSEGFSTWYTKPRNPNILQGAIVGGPDKNDGFQDARHISDFTEPCTYVNSCVIGPLAKLAYRSSRASRKP